MVEVKVLMSAPGIDCSLSRILQEGDYSVERNRILGCTRGSRSKEVLLQ